MRVEAIKVANGFLIPLIDEFKQFKKDKILLDIEFVDQKRTTTSEDDYSSLDAIIGLCETGISEASVNHDKRVYKKGNNISKFFTIMS